MFFYFFQRCLNIAISYFLLLFHLLFISNGDDGNSNNNSSNNDNNNSNNEICKNDYIIATTINIPTVTTTV